MEAPLLDTQREGGIGHCLFVCFVEDGPEKEHQVWKGKRHARVNDAFMLEKGMN